MHVAAATGRPLMEVAHDSFALTLWTHWHLEERDRRMRIAARADRFDLATLFTLAQYDPRRLDEMHMRYLREHSESAAERAARHTLALERTHAHIAAHRRMKPMDVPDAGVTRPEA